LSIYRACPDLGNSGISTLRKSRIDCNRPTNRHSQIKSYISSENVCLSQIQCDAIHSFHSFNALRSAPASLLPSCENDPPLRARGGWSCSPWSEPLTGWLGWKFGSHKDTKMEAFYARGALPNQRGVRFSPIQNERSDLWACATSSGLCVNQKMASSPTGAKRSMSNTIGFMSSKFHWRNALRASAASSRSFAPSRASREILEVADFTRSSRRGEDARRF
jgi:hypothetical protein